MIGADLDLIGQALALLWALHIRKAIDHRLQHRIIGPAGPGLIAIGLQGDIANRIGNIIARPIGKADMPAPILGGGAIGAAAAHGAKIHGLQIHRHADGFQRFAQHQSGDIHELDIRGVQNHDGAAIIARRSHQGFGFFTIMADAGRHSRLGG
ncbi:hypothetical protein JCM17846_26190 [Iodidimonas nitroreducens]|uniref:Uncharacterized protein n=1 Tax=Iodidimonas nitroreducens TaxID=1236968 RepID=A0A5A7NAI4_9PROT|nr:hypothetical protein JCM17846_26190 [Iodidimonas nitroreducens]